MKARVAILIKVIRLVRLRGSELSEYRSCSVSSSAYDGAAPGFYIFGRCSLYDCWI